MPRTDIPEPVRLLELSPGLALWKVHLDSLRERDVNARTMSDDKFRRLSENIKNRGELESFPLVTPIKDRPQEFHIISGHHRTRAARFAGVLIIPVIVIERELTEDEIKAKQLAHNSLAGEDDMDVLKQLYDSIESVDQKLASGLSDLEVKAMTPAIQSDEIALEMEFEQIYILFLKSGHERWQSMLELLEQDATLYAAQYEDFERYTRMINEVSRKENVRNIAGIMAAIMTIVEDHYGVKRKRRR